MNNLKKLPEFDLMSEYKLPTLAYKYNALEPFVDEKTMEIHHTKHHQAYVDNLNKALMGHEASKKHLLEIFSEISKLPAAVRNNGGGHFNHTLFWTILTPNEKERNFEGEIKNSIENNFGSYVSFEEQFTQAALTRFGSGWAWLAVDENNKLFITSSPNQDNPLMDVADKKGIPILGIDVWEHAYYLHYQNRRADYIKSFLKIINWKEVEKRLNLAIK